MPLTRPKEGDTAHVMCSSILSREPDEEHAQEERDRFERVEQQAHRLVRHPPDEDEERDDKQRDLDARADGDGEREVDLVPVSDEDSSDVLGGVANDRE
jgi:hypothetical protein